MTHLKHYGVLGMHWGRRQGSEGSAASEKKVSFSNDVLNSKVKTHKPANVLTGRNVARGILLAYGLLAVKAAIDHLQQHPIRVEVDYTKPPFKWKKPPFYSVKLGKRIARKLLPGG